MTRPTKLNELDPDEILSVGEACRLVPGSASPSTLTRWSRCGLRNDAGDLIRLRAMRVGRRLAFTPRDLIAFFQALGRRDETAA